MATLNITIPNELKEAIDAVAAEDDRSTAALVRVALKEYLERREGELWKS